MNVIFTKVQRRNALYENIHFRSVQCLFYCRHHRITAEKDEMRKLSPAMGLLFFFILLAWRLFQAMAHRPADRRRQHYHLPFLP